MAPSNTLDLYGTFSEPQGLAVGDPYDKKEAVFMTRYTGKQFSAPYQPKGTGMDAMIDKTTRLAIPGDIYIEPYSLTKDLSSRSSIHGKAFVPSGKIKHGFGNTSELMSSTPLGEPQEGSRTTTPSLKGKRNIYVNPPKKGTFGFPIQDRSIGQTRFDFIPDEYERGRILEREMKKEARARIPKAFVSTGRTGKGIELMSTYMGPSSPVPSKKGSGIHGRSWKAPNPPQKGTGYGCISKLEYVPNPAIPPKVEKNTTHPAAFKPPGAYHKRLSMWVPNAYECDARPPPYNDLSLLG